MQLPYDSIDKAIIRNLSHEGRASVSDIAEAVGLSQSACTRRIQALERAGAISGYSVILDQRALGCRVTALVDITLNGQAEELLRAFEQAVGTIPGVVDCVLISGAQDYRLKIICRDLDDYERLHREQLGKLPGVTTINSSFVLRSVSTKSINDAIFA